MPEVMSSEGTFLRVVVPQPTEEGVQPRYVEFQPVPNAKIPADVAALQIEIERTLTTIDMLFPETGKKDTNRQKFDRYFAKIAGIAIAGVGQDQTLFGNLALQALQAEIVLRESGRVKNSYVRRLGYWSAGLVAGFTIAYILARNGVGPAWLLPKREFLTLLIGSFIGSWLSFSIRKVVLSFSELSVLENDQLDPPIRLIFVAGLTLVVGLIFSTQFAEITVGNFHTTFLGSGTYAILIGLFCGIGEQTLATTVGAEATDFIAGLNRQSPRTKTGADDGHPEAHS